MNQIDKDAIIFCTDRLEKHFKRFKQAIESNDIRQLKQFINSVKNWAQYVEMEVNAIDPVYQAEQAALRKQKRDEEKDIS